ncbi:MAG: tRNA pseudouridine(13) synthase TruD [Leptospiraceae bacterium]|nr:tRNA pseudouridine(13) synthase TruD [Leptospiraceae bacterium]
MQINQNDHLQPNTDGPPVWRLSDLPRLYCDRPEFSGYIRTTPEDFVVREVPLYEPCGEGDHVYLELTSTNWNTNDLKRQLCRLFSVRDVDVGYAGLKDRRARTTQRFSILLKGEPESTIRTKLEKHLPDVSCNSIVRHTNKLRTGHLKANAFEILVRCDHPEELQKFCEPVARAIQASGLLNYYGEQRFGREGDNAAQGRAILAGTKRRVKPFLKKLFLSAYQSQLFNNWLAQRVQSGAARTILSGDVARKLASGGLFIVAELEAEMARFQRREITYTGPIFGTRMKAAEGPAAQLEESILKAEWESNDLALQNGDERAGLMQAFARNKLEGTRRDGLVFIEHIDIERSPDGLWFRFELPPGSFATNLLREFVQLMVPSTASESAGTAD